MTFDAVIFDLDGTLIRRTQAISPVYERAFERVGAEPFAAPEHLWPELDGPPDPVDEVGYLGAGFARLAAQHGRRDVDPLALAEAFVAGIDNSQVELHPHASDALSAVDAVGSSALLTNGPESRQATKLDAVGLDDHFDAVTYAGDMPRRKPHAAPFEATLSALGVAPERALYVGNSLKYDVAGAHTAGLAAAWLKDGDGPEPYRPEYVLETLADLPALLE